MTYKHQERLRYREALKKKYDVLLPPEVIKPLTPRKMAAIAQINNNWGFNYHRIGAFKPTYKRNGVVVVFDTAGELIHPDIEPYALNDLGKDFTGEGVQADHYHGIFCAGQYVATNDNFNLGIGARDAIKVIPAKVLNKYGGGAYTWIANAIKHYTQLYKDKFKPHGIFCVFSFSLGGTYKDPQVETALKEARNEGIFIVASAGNRGALKEGESSNIGFPGSSENVMCIGALDKPRNADELGRVAAYSSRGKEIDFTAAGTQVYGCGKDGGYMYASGTSMSCPNFGAAITHLLAAFPEIQKPGDLYDWIAEGVEDHNKNDFDIYTGFGAPFLDAIHWEQYKKEDPKPKPEPPKPEPPSYVSDVTIDNVVIDYTYTGEKHPRYATVQVDFELPDDTKQHEKVMNIYNAIEEYDDNYNIITSSNNPYALLLALNVFFSNQLQVKCKRIALKLREGLFISKTFK